MQIQRRFRCVCGQDRTNGKRDAGGDRRAGRDAGAHVISGADEAECSTNEGRESVRRPSRVRELVQGKMVVRVGTREARSRTSSPRAARDQNCTALSRLFPGAWAGGAAASLTGVKELNEI